MVYTLFSRVSGAGIPKLASQERGKSFCPVSPWAVPTGRLEAIVIAWTNPGSGQPQARASFLVLACGPTRHRPFRRSLCAQRYTTDHGRALFNKTGCSSAAVRSNMNVQVKTVCLQLLAMLFPPPGNMPNCASYSRIFDQFMLSQPDFQQRPVELFNL